MDKTYQLGKSGGGVTSVKIKDHTYDVVEFTVGKYVEGDDGKAIVDSLRLQVGDVRGPQRPTDDDDDLGEKKFNKEIRV